MALQINFSTTQGNDCTSFVLTDETGSYSALTNPGGFGTPNPNVSDILTCTVDITLPDGTILTGLSCILPSLGTETEFDSTDLGLSGDLPEGVYKLNYMMTDTNGYFYTIQKSTLFYCSTQCCLDKAIADIELNTECTDCNTKKIDTVDMINTLLLAAVYAAECNKPKKAQKLLDNAKFICTQRKCNC